jgi:hypothetical protein
MSQIVRLFSRGFFAVIMYLILVWESRSGESGDLENAAEKAKRIQANAPGRSYQTNSPQETFDKRDSRHFTPGLSVSRTLAKYAGVSMRSWP